MTQGNYNFFVGVDWASQKHDVSIVDKEGNRIFEGTFRNSFEGLIKMSQEICNCTQEHPSRIAVAIETPHGPVVELLVDQGFNVYSINPKQLDRFRDRHTVCGAKDDRLDAYVLADSIRTDSQCFRKIILADADMIQLRTLSRVHQNLTVTLGDLSNQLREQLMRYAPHLLELCPAAEKPWFWRLLELTAHPKDVAKFKIVKAKSLLKEFRIRKFSAEKVLKVVQSPHLLVASGVIDAAVMHMEVILAQLILVERQLNKVGEKTKVLLEKLQKSEKPGEHRDAAILLSLPGVGTVVAATMLSEAQQAISDRNYGSIRAQAGVAPVTKRSGKRLSVGMRHACSPRLRNAVYHWSRVSAQVDPVSRQKYAAFRAKGHSHGRALRGLADSLLRCLFGMLKNNMLFDPILNQQRLGTVIAI